MSQQPALTRGVHHVGLTVSDLDGTRDFFTGDGPDIAKPSRIDVGQVGELQSMPTLS